MTENEMIGIGELSDNLCTVCGKWHNCDIRKPCAVCRIFAKDLYTDFNYRKIPDGAVVLNIGKNNEALDEKTIEFFVNHNAKVRKETAREILQDFLNYCALYGCVTHSDILKKVEQYGVEVDK